MVAPHESATTVFYRNIRWLRFVDRFGRKGQAAIEYLGDLAQLAGQIVTESWTRPCYNAEVLHQMDEIGVKSFSITVITPPFAGTALPLHTAYPLPPFAAP